MPISAPDWSNTDTSFLTSSAVAAATCVSVVVVWVVVAAGPPSGATVGAVSVVVVCVVVAGVPLGVVVGSVVVVCVVDGAGVVVVGSVVVVWVVVVAGVVASCASAGVAITSAAVADKSAVFNIWWSPKALRWEKRDRPDSGARRSARRSGFPTSDAIKARNG